VSVNLNFQNVEQDAITSNAARYTKLLGLSARLRESAHKRR